MYPYRNPTDQEWEEARANTKSGLDKDYQFFRVYFCKSCGKPADEGVFCGGQLIGSGWERITRCSCGKLTSYFENA